MLLWALVSACETPVADDGLVRWAGWVYAGSDTTEEARFSEGELSFWLAPYASTEPQAAAQPYEDYPGYWQIDLPPSTPTLVRVTGEGRRPTVWAGDTPAADGNWFAGALFVVDDAWVEDLFDELGANGGAWVAALAQGQVIVLGRPADDSLRCEDLQIEADGAAVAPSCWRVDELGEVTEVRTGPVSWFATTVSAGALRVGIGGAGEDYVADAGDVVMAWYLTGGAE